MTIQKFAKELSDVYSPNALHPELKYSTEHINKTISSCFLLMNENSTLLYTTPYFADFYLLSKTMILRDSFIDFKSIGKWARFWVLISKDFELLSHLASKIYDWMEYLSLKDIATISTFVLTHPDMKFK